MRSHATCDVVKQNQDSPLTTELHCHLLHLFRGLVDVEPYPFRTSDSTAGDSEHVIGNPET